MDYLLTDNLILSGGFGYADTEIKDDANLFVSPAGPLTTVLDPTFVINSEWPVTNAFIDGNPFQHAPKWTANIELDYTYPMSGDSRAVSVH